MLGEAVSVVLGASKTLPVEGAGLAALEPNSPLAVDVPDTDFDKPAKGLASGVAVPEVLTAAERLNPVMTDDSAFSLARRAASCSSYLADHSS
jgi:hypothetical protein